MSILKELGAKWLVEMAEYVAENPQFIVNGFLQPGITGASDGREEDSDTSAYEDDDTDDDTDETDEPEDEFDPDQSDDHLEL